MSLKKNGVRKGAKNIRNNLRKVGKNVAKSIERDATIFRRKIQLRLK